MSRPVSTAHGTALAETLTRPLYLVELGFPVPVRLSSRETTTWNSLLWTAASFRLSMPAGNWTLEVFNEALLLGQTVLTHAEAHPQAEGLEHKVTTTEAALLEVIGERLNRGLFGHRGLRRVGW